LQNARLGRRSQRAGLLPGVPAEQPCQPLFPKSLAPAIVFEAVDGVEDRTLFLAVSSKIFVLEPSIKGVGSLAQRHLRVHATA
jgi:hypothetical protein